MRDIKFKAYVKDLKKILKGMTIDCVNEEVTLEAETTWGVLDYNFDEVEILQSTGVKDKNGVEVYESDIITWDEVYPEDGCYEECGKIIFEDASFLVEVEGYTKFELSQLINQEFLVIGNFFEIENEVGGAENENN